MVNSVEELSRVLMAVEGKSGNAADDSVALTTYFYYENGLSEQENEKGAVKYTMLTAHTES